MEEEHSNILLILLTIFFCKKTKIIFKMLWNVQKTGKCNNSFFGNKKTKKMAKD